MGYDVGVLIEASEVMMTPKEMIDELKKDERIDEETKQVVLSLEDSMNNRGLTKKQFAYVKWLYVEFIENRDVPAYPLDEWYTHGYRFA